MTATPILIGYFPKQTLKRPDWLKAKNVEEVCSVSECTSEGPDGWIDKWKHNAMWVYDSPELALSVVPETARLEFDLYAYGMLAVEFVEGLECPLEFPPINVQPLPTSFERLGYDVVSCSGGHCFDCSPLSCNHMAERVAVNCHCLVDSQDVALELAANFEAEGCEPGPYRVIEVWRQRKDS